MTATPSILTRIERIDGEIARHRAAYLRAYWANLTDTAAIHNREVDRLLSLRFEAQSSLSDYS